MPTVSTLSPSKSICICAISALSVCAASTAWSATSVLPGFDLFFTPRAGATFVESGNAFAFESFATAIGAGVGCGNNQFDFDNGLGCINVFNTDTIVRRLDEATEISGPIAIEMISLSLRSVNPLPIFGLPEIIGARILKELATNTYIYGGDNGSMMEIIFDDHNGGTWISSLDLTIQLYGFDSGMTVDIPKTFTHQPVEWDRGPGSLRIPGINFQLNGANSSNDFWTSGTVVHDDGGGTIHKIDPPSIPVPATLPLALSGIALFGGLAAARQRRAAAA